MTKEEILNLYFKNKQISVQRSFVNRIQIKTFFSQIIKHVFPADIKKTFNN
jgi:hypothetical protein